MEIRFPTGQEAQIHMEIRNDVGTSSVSKYFDLDSITPDPKRRKEALKDQCESEKAVSYRKAGQILKRLKQFDIFFLFVFSLPFVTVWLVYITATQFCEIFGSCCSNEEEKEDEENEDENDEKNEENEEEDGEDEEEEEEVKIEEKDQILKKIEKNEEEKNEEIKNVLNEESKEEKKPSEKEQKGDEGDWNVVKRKPNKKKGKKVKTK